MSAYIVVDSNFIGRGQFDADRLEGLAERVKFTGALVVVPEVVIWEWAEHAHSVMEDAERAVKDMLRRVDRSVAPRFKPPDVPAVDELVATISARIERMWNVTIERTTGDAAVGSLRAQVLLTGGATHRKDGTKTGAADALILECLKAQTTEHTYGVVLGSSDKRLISASEAALPEVKVARSHNDLFQQIFDRAPDLDSLIEYVDEFARDEAASSTGYGQDVAHFTMGYELIPGPDDDLDGVRLGLAMRRVELIETDEFTPLTNGEVQLATIQVDLFGTLVITETSQDEDEDPVTEDHVIDNVKVSVPSLVTFDEEWRPLSIEVTGRSRIYFH